MVKSTATQPETPVDYHNLPEFKTFDNPFGLKLYNFYRIWFPLAHFWTFYFLWLVATTRGGCLPLTAWILGLTYGYMNGLAITIGSHRYWTHKTFKANKPLQVFMMLLQGGAGQESIFRWSRLHRVHHKYTDTDADPHNSTRGFWFSHIFWTMQPRHPECEKAFKTVDLSDLANDPIVRFQNKYYYLIFLYHFLIPHFVLYMFYPEVPFLTGLGANFARYILALHFTFLVNSAAHLWGDKPYDKYIRPTDNKLVSAIALGEGFHNYHHTFPWDYRAAEFGFKYNPSTVIIHFFAWMGWAWDLKTVNQKTLVDRLNRTGDGSHSMHKKGEGKVEGKTEEDFKNSASWGWGDEIISEEDLNMTETVYLRSNVSKLL